MDFPTSDVLLELIVGLLKCLNQLRDAALLDQGHLVFHILIDEVACGASSVTLHFLVLRVEKLHQFADALVVTNLRTGGRKKRSA